MMIVSRAFEIATMYRIGKRPSDADLATVFGALKVLYSALSKRKQRQLRPPLPKKRGAKRKWMYYEHEIGKALHEALRDNKFSEAEKIARRQLKAEGIPMPDGEKMLRDCLNRYRRRDTRPYLKKT